MKLANHEDIVQAIHDCREVVVEWRSQDDGGTIQRRRCAPMDYALSRRFHDQAPRYHFFDFESDSGWNHPLSLLSSQIERVEVLESTFDPAMFVTWDTRRSPWVLPRSTWGDHN
ncbi:hypothetical protein [Nocardioides zeae]|uniref:DUF3024 domain-containing protein n=1 Tax=Nocardioides zeae TaxID=1457234 RepID=A0A6P0HMP2_9ACTN|nr:hypothetical protein [Nocardioides zeae]NEN79948.1 hypothetical protein [Nocardioides zeae]